jgi:hypothetical protein
MDNAFKVVVVNTLNWIALYSAMSGALVTVDETSKTKGSRPRGTKTRSGAPANIRKDDSTLAANVVRFPGPVARRKAARPASGRSQRKRKAEILIFPSHYSA